jgi:hypothetical protein
MLWNETFLVSGSVARGAVPMTDTRFWRKDLNEKSNHWFSFLPPFIQDNNNILSKIIYKVSLKEFNFTRVSINTSLW